MPGGPSSAPVAEREEHTVTDRDSFGSRARDEGAAAPLPRPLPAPLTPARRGAAARCRSASIRRRRRRCFRHTARPAGLQPASNRHRAAAGAPEPGSLPGVSLPGRGGGGPRPPLPADRAAPGCTVSSDKERRRSPTALSPAGILRAGGNATRPVHLLNFSWGSWSGRRI